MRDAVEELYAPLVRNGEPKGTYPLEVPQGITPQTWYVAMDSKAETVSAGTFDGEYAQPAATVLAAEGQRLGLTDFARLQVIDRPAARHRGSARVHQRNRQFIVHALGWK